jgi:hypothetical protein
VAAANSAHTSLKTEEGNFWMKKKEAKRSHRSNKPSSIISLLKKLKILVFFNQFTRCKNLYYLKVMLKSKIIAIVTRLLCMKNRA